MEDRHVIVQDMNVIYSGHGNQVSKVFDRLTDLSGRVSSSKLSKPEKTKINEIEAGKGPFKKE